MYATLALMIWQRKLNNMRQGKVTMTIVREGIKTLETSVTLGCRFKFLSVGAFPSLLNIASQVHLFMMFLLVIQERMTAMLDNPKGRDCNEMVGLPSEARINTKEGRDSKVFHLLLLVTIRPLCPILLKSF